MSINWSLFPCTLWLFISGDCIQFDGDVTTSAKYLLVNEFSNNAEPWENRSCEPSMESVARFLAVAVHANPEFNIPSEGPRRVCTRVGT